MQEAAKSNSNVTCIFQRINLTYSNTYRFRSANGCVNCVVGMSNNLFTKFNTTPEIETPQAVD